MAGQQGPPASATAAVTRQDIAAVTPVTATPGYARSYPVTGGGGTLTWLPSPGQVLASLGHGRGEGSEAVSPVAMVWPYPLPVDAYVAAGREVSFPRPDCPACAGPLVFWSGYRRYVRAAGRCQKVFVPRLRCGCCRVSHALLPAFVLAWRLDVAETVGAVIGQVAGGVCGVRPAAASAGVPYTTARGWVRLFRCRTPGLGAGFAGLAVELRSQRRRSQPGNRPASDRVPRGGASHYSHRHP